MMAQEPDAAEPMLSRSLLVHDGTSLRRLDQTPSLVILLPYEEQLQREANLVENHHVVFVVTDGDADIELPPHDHLTLRAALQEAGVPGENLDRFWLSWSKEFARSAAGRETFRTSRPGTVGNRPGDPGYQTCVAGGGLESAPERRR